MKTPAIQNDFSYYRRTIARQRMCSTDDAGDPMEVNTELANRMSLFYAHATPMLRVLSDAVSQFVLEVSEILNNEFYSRNTKIFKKNYNFCFIFNAAWYISHYFCRQLFTN